MFWCAGIVTNFPEFVSIFWRAIRRTILQLSVCCVGSSGRRARQSVDSSSDYVVFQRRLLRSTGGIAGVVGLIRRSLLAVKFALGAVVLFQRGNRSRGRADVRCAGVRRGAVGPALQSVARRPCQQESAGTGCGFHLPFDGAWRAALELSAISLHFPFDLWPTAIRLGLDIESRIFP